MDAVKVAREEDESSLGLLRRPRAWIAGMGAVGSCDERGEEVALDGDTGGKARRIAEFSRAGQAVGALARARVVNGAGQEEHERCAQCLAQGSCGTQLSSHRAPAVSGVTAGSGIAPQVGCDIFGVQRT